MQDKKKIAIAFLLSVIVFIATILVQVMLEQRPVQQTNANPAAQIEAVRDPAASAQPAGPAQSATPAQSTAPAQPGSVEQIPPAAAPGEAANKAVPAAQ